MVCLRKVMLKALILVCFCVPGLSQEPNEANRHLKFEVSNEELLKGIRIPAGPIRPIYVAQLRIAGGTLPKEIELWQTPAAENLSQMQRKFMKTSEYYYTQLDVNVLVRGYRGWLLYAVSENDARTMVESFLEMLTQGADDKMRSCEREVQVLKEDIENKKTQIPKKEEELKVVESNFDALKKNVHYLTVDDARESILKLNTMLNSLDIELSGMRAREQAIRTALERQIKKPGKPEVREKLITKLEEMLIEQTVDLRTVEAKRQTAKRLCVQAEEYCELVGRKNLPREIQYLKSRLAGLQADLNKREEALSNPPPDMIPPKVYENKVTIYPVSAGQ